MVKVIAHRGASSSYPENSLEAIEESARLGVEMVEVDLRLTKDQIPVLFHDKKLKRLLGRQGNLSEMTFKEWQECKILDTGTPYSFQDFLVSSGSPRKSILDIKEFGMESIVSKMIERAGCMQDIIVSSFYSLIVRRFKSISPEVRTALILDRTATTPFALGMSKLAKPYLKWTGVECIHMCYRPANLKAAEDLRLMGYEVAFWTIDEPQIFKEAAKVEPYGIMTNNPEAMLKLEFR